MEAHSPARSLEHSTPAAIPGDFALGLRAPGADLGSSGDFATGIPRATETRATGNFATGMCSRREGAATLGDFATGMRARGTVPPVLRRQPAGSGPRLSGRTEPAT